MVCLTVGHDPIAVVDGVPWMVSGAMVRWWCYGGMVSGVVVRYDGGAMMCIVLTQGVP
jgi:hypothetical protein